MQKRALVGISILVVLAVIGVILVWQSTQTNRDSASVPVYTPATTPSSRASSPAAPTSARPASTTSPAPAKVPAGCMPTLKEIEGTQFSIDQMSVKVPMMSLGEDESGAAAAPPKDASHVVGWWKNGPKIGSDKGHAILTIHTYQNGRALGNELNAKDGFQTGDLVRISDARGNTQCYTLERSLKVWVKDYDPNSDVLYKYDGAPLAVIVICWDYNRMAKEWDSRILYYLKPVATSA